MLRVRENIKNNIKNKTNFSERFFKIIGSKYFLTQKVILFSCIPKDCFFFSITKAAHIN